MKKIWENLIKKINSLEFKSNLFFIFSAFAYINLSYYFFLNDFRNNDYFNQNLSYLSLISQNLEKNFAEKNLELKFENNTYTANVPEPITLQNYDSRITAKKNLLYISKDAEDKDFKEKDTFMILNSKDLKIEIGEEPIIYPIESLQTLKNRLNEEELKKLNSEFYKGSPIYNQSGLNLILIFKGLEFLFLLIVANYILIYFVYGILYLSGYKNLNPISFRPYSLIFLGIYLLIKLPFGTFVFEPSFTSTLLVISVIIAILEKKKLEKN